MNAASADRCEARVSEVHAFDGCRVRVATAGDEISVEVLGELDMSNSSGVRSVLLGTLNRSARVVVDLANVRFIDSSGLGALLRVAEAARQSEVRFAVVHPSAAARRVMITSGVEQFLLDQSPPAQGSATNE